MKINKLSIFIITFVIFCGGYKVCAADNVLQGHIEEKSKNQKEQSELYTGSIDKLDKNAILKMTVSKVLDGNTAKENDEFFAEVTEDVEGSGGILIPRGTVAHGCISRVETAKKFCRNGLLDLSFDYLVTPDGKQIPINGKMSTRLHPLKDTSEVLVNNLAYTAAGGVTGGLLAMGFAGVAGTVSSQGTIIAGGAALGGSAGLAVALYNKGKDVLISQGDEILVKVYTDSNLPVYKKTAFPQRELVNKDLDIEVKDVLFQKNPYGEIDKIVLDVCMANRTKNDISTFDIALSTDSGTVYYPDAFDDNQMFKSMKSGEKFAGKIPFSVDNVKSKFWLAVYDNKTREAISEISLNSAYKNISDKTRKNNEKLLKKEKKDFYKEYNPFTD